MVISRDELEKRYRTYQTEVARLKARNAKLDKANKVLDTRIAGYELTLQERWKKIQSLDAQLKDKGVVYDEARYYTDKIRYEARIEELEVVHEQHCNTIRQLKLDREAWMREAQGLKAENKKLQKLKNEGVRGMDLRMEEKDRRIAELEARVNCHCGCPACRGDKAVCTYEELEAERDNTYIAVDELKAELKKKDMIIVLAKESAGKGWNPIWELELNKKDAPHSKEKPFSCKDCGGQDVCGTQFDPNDCPHKPTPETRGADNFHVAKQELINHIIKEYGDTREDAEKSVEKYRNSKKSKKLPETQRDDKCPTCKGFGIDKTKPILVDSEGNVVAYANCRTCDGTGKKPKPDKEDK